MSVKIFLTKRVGTEKYDVYTILTEFGQVFIHGYPVDLEEQDIKIDSHHLTLDEFDGTMADGVQFLQNLCETVQEVEDLTFEAIKQYLKY